MHQLMLACRKHVGAMIEMGIQKPRAIKHCNYQTPGNGYYAYCTDTLDWTSLFYVDFRSKLHPSVLKVRQLLENLHVTIKIMSGCVCFDVISKDIANFWK